MQLILDFLNSTSLTTCQQILLTVITFCVLTILEPIILKIFNCIVTKMKKVTNFLVSNVKERIANNEVKIERMLRLYNCKVTFNDYIELEEKKEKALVNLN